MRGSNRKARLFSMSKFSDSPNDAHEHPGYIAPFSVLKRAISVNKSSDGRVRVDMSLEVFGKIFELALRQVGFDEAGYLERNPDVAKALEKGEIKSAIGHFANNGYFENRPVKAPAADAAWYLKEYPDVAKSVEQGKTRSAGEHWVNNGYFEGRAPSSQLSKEVASWLSLATR